MTLIASDFRRDFEDVLERGYGLELPGRNDVGVGLRDGSNFYKMETKFSTDNVRAFVESWSRGELAGLEQQQAEMEGGGEEYTGPTSVVTLTNDNFKQEVTDTNKDVMVEFYGELNLHIILRVHSQVLISFNFCYSSLVWSLQELET